MSNLTIIANEHDIESLISSLCVSLLTDANVYTVGDIINDDVNNDVCWLGIDPTASNTEYGTPMADRDHYIYTTGQLALYKGVKGCTDIITSYIHYNNDGYIEEEDGHNSLLRVVLRDDECAYGMDMIEHKGVVHNPDYADLLNLIRSSAGYVNDFYTNKLDLSSLALVSLLVEVAYHNLKYGKHAAIKLYKELTGKLTTNSTTGESGKVNMRDLNDWYLNRMREAKSVINKRSMRKAFTTNRGDIHVMYSRLHGLDWFVAKRLLTMSKQAYFNIVANVLTDTYSTNVDIGLSKVMEYRSAIAM